MDNLNFLYALTNVFVDFVVAAKFCDTSSKKC